MHVQLYYICIGSQLIIDTHVEEISTLCGEECTSSSLLVLRLEIHVHMYTSIVIVLGNIDNLIGRYNIQKYHGTVIVMMLLVWCHSIKIFACISV